MSAGARSSRRHGTAAARTPPIALCSSGRGARGFAGVGRIFFFYGPQEHPDRLVPSVASGAAPRRASRDERRLAGPRLHARRRCRERVRDAGRRRSAGSGKHRLGQPTTVRDVITLVAEAAGGLDRVDFGALPMRAGEPSRSSHRRSAPGGGRLSATDRPRRWAHRDRRWWREQVAGDRPGCGPITASRSPRLIRRRA